MPSIYNSIRVYIFVCDVCLVDLVFKLLDLLDLNYIILQVIKSEIKFINI